MSIALHHNNPPSSIEFAQEAMRDLSEFLENMPVIETAEQASQAGMFIERMRKTLAEVEDDRDRQVRPLNDAVAQINGKYHAIHNENGRKPGTADKLLAELRRRLTAYAQAEEDKRLAALAAAAAAAAEAERLARDAEAREREAIENAKLGECADVGSATIEADVAFALFERASRAAAVAEKDVQVRIASSLGGRALTMRTTETLVIESVNKAIIAMGATEKIKQAILSSARDYRKQHGTLPPGIRADETRAI
jgi:hypothetical protein